MNHRNGSRACGNVEKSSRAPQTPEFVGIGSSRAGTYGGIARRFSSQVSCGEAPVNLGVFPIPQTENIFRPARRISPRCGGEENPCFRTKVRVFPRLKRLSTVFRQLSTVFRLSAWVNHILNNQIWGRHLTQPPPDFQL